MPANPDHPKNARGSQEVANILEKKIAEITDQDLIDTYEGYLDAVQRDVNVSIVKFLQSMPVDQRDEFIQEFNTRINAYQIVEA